MVDAGRGDYGHFALAQRLAELSPGNGLAGFPWGIGVNKPLGEAREAGDQFEPKPIERPDKESVVKAIKRLSETYYMLQREHLLDQTSSLMMSHVMQGRDAVSVIDELEIVFSEHYERYLQRLDDR